MPLVGELSETRFSDLIQLYVTGRQTAAVWLTGSDGEQGVVYVQEGDVVDARLGDLVGRDAIRRALTLDGGHFRVEPGVRATSRTIHQKWTHVLLHELVKLDEERRLSTTSRHLATPPAAGASASASGRQVPVPPRVPKAPPPAWKAPPPAAAGSGADPHTPVLALPLPPPRPGAAPAAHGASVDPGTAPASTAAPPGGGTPAAPVHARPERAAAERTPAARPLPARLAAGELQAVPAARGQGPAAPAAPVPASDPGVAAGAAAPAAQAVRVDATQLFAVPRPEGVLHSGSGRAALAAAAVVLVLGVVAGSAVMKARAPKRRALPGEIVPAPAAVPADPSARPELVLGMSAAFSGANKELGRGMKMGLELALAAANEAGGVGGRKLRLVALDDGNEPSRAAPAVRELLEDRHVFAIVGNVGSAGAAAAIPVATAHRTVFFGAMAGGESLRRNPPDRYVFNFRPGYAEEAQAAVRYLTTVRRIAPEDLAFFGQEDGYGDAGWAGLVRELERQGKSAKGVLRTGYRRNSLDVRAAVAKVRKARHVRAVVMMATYEPAARFIQGMKESGASLVYTNASPVESAALAEGLVQANVPIADDIVVTQVTPLPTSHATAVLRYRQLLAARGQGDTPASISLEGYLTGLLFVEALKRAGPDADAEKLVATLESLRDVDLGIGVRLGFSPTEHQASHKIWGTMLQPNGTYRPIDLE